MPVSPQETPRPSVNLRDLGQQLRPQMEGRLGVPSRPVTPDAGNGVVSPDGPSLVRESAPVAVAAVDTTDSATNRVGLVHGSDQEVPPPIQAEPVRTGETPEPTVASPAATLSAEATADPVITPLAAQVVRIEASDNPAATPAPASQVDDTVAEPTAPAGDGSAGSPVTTSGAGGGAPPPDQPPTATGPGNEPQEPEAEQRRGEARRQLRRRVGNRLNPRDTSPFADEGLLERPLDPDVAARQNKAWGEVLSDLSAAQLGPQEVEAIIARYDDSWQTRIRTVLGIPSPATTASGAEPVSSTSVSPEPATTDNGPADGRTEVSAPPRLRTFDSFLESIEEGLPDSREPEAQAESLAGAIVREGLGRVAFDDLSGVVSPEMVGMVQEDLRKRIAEARTSGTPLPNETDLVRDFKLEPTASGNNGTAAATEESRQVGARERVRQALAPVWAGSAGEQAPPSQSGTGDVEPVSSGNEAEQPTPINDAEAETRQQTAIKVLDRLMNRLQGSETQIQELEPAVVLERLRIGDENACVAAIVTAMERGIVNAGLLIEVGPGMRAQIINRLSPDLRARAIRALESQVQNMAIRPDDYVDAGPFNVPMAQNLTQWIESNRTPPGQGQANEGAQPVSPAAPERIEPAPPIRPTAQPQPTPAPQTSGEGRQDTQPSTAEVPNYRLQDARELLGTYDDIILRYPRPEVRQADIIEDAVADLVAGNVTETQLATLLALVRVTDGQTRIEDAFFEKIAAGDPNNEWNQGWRQTGRYRKWQEDKQVAEAAARARSGRSIWKRLFGGRENAQAAPPEAGTRTREQLRATGYIGSLSDQIEAIDPDSSPEAARHRDRLVGRLVENLSTIQRVFPQEFALLSEEVRNTVREDFYEAIAGEGYESTMQNAWLRDPSFGGWLQGRLEAARQRGGAMPPTLAWLENRAQALGVTLGEPAAPEPPAAPTREPTAPPSPDTTPAAPAAAEPAAESVDAQRRQASLDLAGDLIGGIEAAHTLQTTDAIQLIDNIEGLIMNGGLNRGDAEALRGRVNRALDANPQALEELQYTYIDQMQEAYNGDDRNSVERLLQISDFLTLDSMDSIKDEVNPAMREYFNISEEGE